MQILPFDLLAEERPYLACVHLSQTCYSCTGLFKRSNVWITMGQKTVCTEYSFLGEPPLNLLSVAFTLPKLFSSMGVLGSTEKPRPGSLPTGKAQFVQAAVTAGAVTFNLWKSFLLRQTFKHSKKKNNKRKQKNKPQTVQFYKTLCMTAVTPEFYVNN